MSRPLENYSDAQLLEELARRANERRDAEIPPDWCHDCAHYRTWDKPSDPPPRYNPCSKRHAMQFRQPRDYDETQRGEFGYFRAVCTDREPASDA
jgi:hypothetical protein